MGKGTKRSIPKKVTVHQAYVPKSTPEPTPDLSSPTIDQFQDFQDSPPKPTSPPTILPYEADCSRPTSEPAPDRPETSGESSGKVVGGDRVGWSKEEADEGSWSELGEGVDEALSRLEEMRVGEEELNLSEEEIRSNAQLQDDELLVLEAIYGENIVTLDRKGDLRSFQMYVHYNDPDGLTLSSKLETSSEKLKTGGKVQEDIKASDGSSEFMYSFKVRYLPPIVLTCLLTQSYPSQKSPSYTISAQWLDSQKISVLCDMLDTIWSDNPGQEVIYRWIEWLHSSALSYLGFDDGVILGPYGMPKSDDKRAISGIVAPEVDIPSIISYNEKRCHEDFLSNLQQCVICFSDYPGKHFIKLQCQHYFCQDCMKTYCNMHVKEGTVTKLLCPDAKCGGIVPPFVLKQLLDGDDFDRWESLLFQKTLDKMSDVMYCPRCGTACWEDEDHHAQCAKCYFSFCSLCRERRHVGVHCMTLEEKLQILEEYRDLIAGDGNNRIGQRDKEKAIINEILSVREVLRDSRQCPSCQMAISRTEGCNKMVCNNCGQFFCYRCNKKITGYDHFREGCILFDAEEIRRWEERVNPRQVVQRIQAELHPDQGHPCPICGQHNPKMDNNNHMFCWSCQNHYCALCWKPVRKSKDHFGPKGCKQHS